MADGIINNRASEAKVFIFRKGRCLYIKTHGRHAFCEQIMFGKISGVTFSGARCDHVSNSVSRACRGIRNSEASLGRMWARRAQRYTCVCASAANPQTAQDRRCLFRTECVPRRSRPKGGDRNCAADERKQRPLGAALQEEASNRPELL